MSKRIWRMILTLCLLLGMAPPRTTAAYNIPPDTAPVAEAETLPDAARDETARLFAENLNLIFGDVNADGAVNQDDLSMLSNALLNNLNLTDEQLYAADVIVSDNPGLDSGDIMWLQSYLEGQAELGDTSVASNLTAQGYCGAEGTNLMWSLDKNGTLTISGSGAMSDSPSWDDIRNNGTNYKNQITTVVMESGVTSIGNSAFYGCSSLTSVTIPESVTSIGNDAFHSCSGLTSVTIPESITSIGGAAFYSCSGLTSITIPDSVTSIGNEAFAYCSSLTSVTISNSVTSFGYAAFSNCSGLTSVTIPNSVTSIGSAAFSRSGLTSVTIPESVTSIGYSAFDDCSALTDVYYSGTETQWATLKGNIASGNDPLLNATIHYNSSGGVAETYVVTFNASGGTPETLTQNVSSGGTATAPANPTRDGYEFLGWFTDAALTMAFDFTTPITANLTLYAGWRQLAPVADCTVTFDGNGGLPQTSAYVVEMNTTVSPPATNPTRDGYEFTGWFTDAALTMAFDFTTPITANLTLYAGWKVADCTVTFDGNGGLPQTTAYVVEMNTTVSPPATNPTRDGYEFTGWFTDAAATMAFDFTTPITANLTLYAGWSAVNSGEPLNPYRVLESLHDMDSYEDQTWHLAGALSEFRTLTIDETTLTRGADYAAEEGSTKLNIPAGTFARFGEGTHSIAADFQTSPDPAVYNDDGTRTAAEYYTVKPSGKVTIDAADVNAAKAVKDVSYTARFSTNPRLNDDYYRFIVTGGQIPTGLTFHEGGYFTGVILNVGVYAFTVGLQIRRNADDPWPDYDAYEDAVQVTITVEEDTAPNVDTASDPGYELVERIPAVVEESGDMVYLTSKGPFDEFTEFYIDGVKQERGVDYEARACLIDPASGQMIRLLDGGLITGTHISLSASKLSVGTHSLNLEFVATDPIGNKQTRNASQKVTVTKKATPVYTGGGSSGSSGRSTTPAVTRYTVKVSKSSHGKVALSASKVAAGNSVTITVTPDSGYQTETVSVVDSKKTAVKTSRSGNQYTFTMPSRAVTVSASFAPSVYSLTVSASQHGKVTLNRASASKGAAINGSAAPDKGYRLQSVSVRDVGGRAVKVETFDNGQFTFLMPEGRVTVSAAFIVKRLASFTDIQGPDWFFEDAEWAYNRGIIRGVTPEQWQPQELISSVTSIVTLERLDGVDLTPYDTGADDGLDNSAWYVAALRWANANRITLSDRPFGGREAIRRGEFAVMLSNYLRYRGVSAEAPADATFTDADALTEDELHAFRVLQAADVFRGYSDGSVRPETYLTRAQLSALLHRLSQYIIQAESGT